LVSIILNQIYLDLLQKTCPNVKICAKNKSVPTILFEKKIQKLV